MIQKFLLVLLLISLLSAPQVSAATAIYKEQEAAPVGHLSIPSQGIEQDIYLSEYDQETYTWDQSVWDADRVAWLDQTGWIDTDLNTAFVSHTDGPLHDILWMAVGDYVYVSDSNYVATYIVTETIITSEYDVIAVVAQSGGPRMTMSVCWGNQERYIVRATRVSLETIAAVG